MHVQQLAEEFRRTTTSQLFSIFGNNVGATGRKRSLICRIPLCKATQYSNLRRTLYSDVHDKYRRTKTSQALLLDMSAVVELLGRAVARWTPAEARLVFKQNAFTGRATSGSCLGFLQACMAMLPSALADDFEQFCELNKAACPLLYRSKRGEIAAGPLARNSDIRYELEGVLTVTVSFGNSECKESRDLCIYHPSGILNYNE